MAADKQRVPGTCLLFAPLDCNFNFSFFRRSKIGTKNNENNRFMQIFVATIFAFALAKIQKRIFMTKGGK